MAEIQYLDDHELQVSENLAGVDWEEIENGGAPSEGEHKFLIKKVRPAKKDWENYTGKQAVVQLVVAEGPEKGKTILDWIPLPHPSEPKWAKDKRLLVAKRTGLISRDSKSTVDVNWKSLEGRTVICEVQHREYTKDGVKKTGTQFNTFKSYRDPALEPDPAAAASSAASASTKDQYPDI